MRSRHASHDRADHLRESRPGAVRRDLPGQRGAGDGVGRPELEDEVEHYFAVRAGVGHHLALSIVGVAEAPHGYYAGKLAQERRLEASPVPWTILRATQFHEFAGQILTRTRVGPVAMVPMMRSQPVAAAEVAARLLELIEAGPAGHAPDLAGPQEERMADLARRWATATGARGRVVEVAVPGAMGRALGDGTQLPGPDARLGRLTFADWLTAGAGAGGE